MRESRGPWYLLTGVVIGLALGVLYGWLIAPVSYTDTQPHTLRAELKDEYRTLIALAYLSNGNAARAQTRLELLRDVNPAEEIGEHGRFGRCHPRRRYVEIPVGWMDDAVVRRARSGCGFAGDHVGHLLEPAAVVRHESESATKLALLDDTMLTQQIGEGSSAHCHHRPTLL